MAETTHFVTYFIAQQQRPGQPRTENPDETIRQLFTNPNEEFVSQAQKQAIEDFMEPRQHSSEIVGSFVEIPEHKRTNKWPQLSKAIENCKLRGATLLIAELGTLTSNETFTQLLLDSGVQFHCCDQPFVNQTILEALYKHAQVQRKLHGKLIKEGLKMTNAKSGNPNAAEVISKVNKPKIDTAILFAMLLQTIITDYRAKGYSQRQMVKTLNEEGFTAPEGGKWVLSQLQKVLDRVKLNEVALNLEQQIAECRNNNMSAVDIAEQFNHKEIPALKRGAWDEGQVNKLIDRIDQIKDVKAINQFILTLLPIIQELRRRNLSAVEMITQFEKSGLPVKQQSAEAA